MKRVNVFIELANLNGALKIIAKNGEKLQVDFSKAINLVAIGSQVIGKNIYTESPADDEKGRGFLFFLEKNGFRVISKKAKVIYMPENGDTKTKANFDVEIAVDISDASWKRECDEIILFSGDSDFAYVINKAKERGISATVVSSRRTLSEELRKTADRIILLDDIIEKVKK